MKINFAIVYDLKPSNQTLLFVMKNCLSILENQVIFFLEKVFQKCRFFRNEIKKKHPTIYLLFTRVFEAINMCKIKT